MSVISLDTTEGTRRIDVTELVIAGWAGRDRHHVEEHIRELEAIGVPRPSRVPLFYRLSAQMLTQDETIEVLGPDSSGEAEAVLVGDTDGTIWVTVGSDHTDRRGEAYSVAVSKQMCPKPVARDAWRFDEVAPHWDRLILRSRAVFGTRTVLYQEGPVNGLLDPRELVRDYNAGRDGLAPGQAMLCGTLAVIGGIRPADAFEVQLEDPVLGRRITHRYTPKILPVVA